MNVGFGATVTRVSFPGSPTERRLSQGVGTGSNINSEIYG